MDSFFKYANAAQKAVITGITSAHKEFFENLDSNQTKLEFVVGEQQKGGGNSGKFKVYSKFNNPGKCYGPYWEYKPMVGGEEENTNYQNSKVKEIKIENFNKEVFKQSKDVMVVFYSPGCPACQNLNSIYKEVGKYYQNKNVKILAVDAIESLRSHLEPPIEFEIKYYPTIYFLKKGEIKPIEYDGFRDIESFKKFINKHKTKQKRSMKTKKNKNKKPQIPPCSQYGKNYVTYKRNKKTFCRKNNRK